MKSYAQPTRRIFQAALVAATLLGVGAARAACPLPTATCYVSGIPSSPINCTDGGVQFNCVCPPAPNAGTPALWVCSSSSSCGGFQCSNMPNQTACTAGAAKSCCCWDGGSNSCKASGQCGASGGGATLGCCLATDPKTGTFINCSGFPAGGAKNQCKKPCQWNPLNASNCGKRNADGTIPIEAPAIFDRWGNTIEKTDGGSAVLENKAKSSLENLSSALSERNLRAFMKGVSPDYQGGDDELRGEIRLFLRSVSHANVSFSPGALELQGDKANLPANWEQRLTMTDGRQISRKGNTLFVFERKSGLLAGMKGEPFWQAPAAEEIIPKKGGGSPLSNDRESVACCTPDWGTVPTGSYNHPDIIAFCSGTTQAQCPPNEAVVRCVWNESDPRCSNACAGDDTRPPFNCSQMPNQNSCTSGSAKDCCYWQGPNGPCKRIGE